MQITNTTAALRPRSVWEAIDLGFVLAQAWWWPLYRLWLGVALPVFLLCSLIGYDNPVVAAIIFWWLKPAYEQLPLIYLSRALFKQDPSIKIYSWSSLKIIFKQLLWNISFRRLSPIRSFTAAVSQLEGLSGSARSRRLESLTRNAPGFWQFTAIMMNFELFFTLSLSLIVMFVIPENVEIAAWYDDNKILIDHLSNILYFISASIVAPFFVSGGFSMYINRRTILEGWDIEIEFKRLQERLQRSAKNVAAWVLPLLLLPTLVLSMAVASPASAASDPQEYEQAPLVSKESAKKTIEEIMADKDFGHKETVKRWKYTGDWKWKRDTNSDLEYQNMGFLENLGVFISQIGEIILWIAIGVLVVLLLYYLPGWLNKIPTPTKNHKREKQKPNVLFGLNVEKNSLPDDVAATALALMQKGDVRQSLSLLYRASLSLLINHHGLDVHDSHTEGECLELVESLGKSEISAYFDGLTQAWISLAYGHRTPTESTLQSLCHNWSHTFNTER